MSHFPVLVIGEEPVKLLQPYHEFECTGFDDEYVQDLDETQNTLLEYAEATTSMLVSPEGERFDYYDKRFYTGIPTDSERERGLTDNYRVTPEGWEAVEVPTKELKTFTEYVLGQVEGEEGESAKHILRPGQERDEGHKYRFIELDENDEVRRVVRRTNPNSHWDGWVLGGRWGRFFKLKPDSEFIIDDVGNGDLYTKDSWLQTGTEEELEAYANHPATRESRRELVAELTAAHSTDHVRVKDIDFEAGRDRAEERARTQFAKWRVLFVKHGKPLPFSHFTEMRDTAVAKLKEQGIDKEELSSLYESVKYLVTRENQEDERARMSYNAQPTLKAANKIHLSGFRSSPMEMFGYDEEAYVAKMRNKAMIPYAVIKDGKWFAKGKMHMFAHSDDNMTDEEWCAQVHKLYAELPEDALLTLVDCHV